MRLSNHAYHLLEFLDLRSHVWGIRECCLLLSYLPSLTILLRTRPALAFQEGQHFRSNLINVDSMNRFEFSPTHCPASGCSVCLPHLPQSHIHAPALDVQDGPFSLASAMTDNRIDRSVVKTFKLYPLSTFLFFDLS